MKLRQTSNQYKRILEATNFGYGNWTKESITSKKFGSLDFWQTANSLLNIGKSGIPPLFNGPEGLFPATDKAKLFAKNILRTLILMIQVSPYLLSLLNLI